MADYTTPELVGYFSRDGSHEFRIDLSLLRYLTADLDKVVPLDLRSYDVKNYKIDKEKYPFLRFILNHLDIIREIGGNSIMDAPIITKSPALYRLWYKYKYSNYSYEDIFDIHLVKGKIYFLVENNFQDGSTPPAHMFSRALLSNIPDGEPNMTIDAIEHFFGVFQMKLKSHTLIYQNVIDCILANTDGKKTPVCDDDETSTLEDLRKREFVKFKTTYSHPGDWNFQMRKSSELWMKGFFANALVCNGFRTNDDVIDEIKMYNLQQLRDMNPRFSPDEFFQELDLIFRNIKKLLIQEGTKLKCLEDVNDIPKITIRLASREFGIFRRIDDNKEFDLPDWFLDGIKKNL